MSETARDLKIMALKEVISRDKVQYEDQIADLRVELTQVTQSVEQLTSENTELRQQIDSLAGNLAGEDTEKGEVVEGELVQEEKPARTKKSAK